MPNHTLPKRLAIFVISLALVTATGGALAPAAVASERQEASLLTATQVLEELQRMPEQRIPSWLLDRAHGVAVIPEVVKIGLIFGGRRGKGVLTVRNSDGSWGNPVFVNLTGGSVGFQAGVQSSDIVLVFTSRQSIEGIVGGKVTLGADASVAAGPVGRQSSAATDIGLNAQVYSYSRARGLFAGVALDGSALTIDHRSNEAFYGRPGVLPSEIMREGAPAAREPAPAFIAAVRRSVSGEPQAAAPAAGASASSTQPPTRTRPPTAHEGGATTYPMEDPNPGQEPPQ
ncbi:MAG TPA: lipid-binding SYLF domain-containing protein [Steroidobacter sp.]|jgi:lipid-binding SYLF domain-containing protein|nr:lipid-binding SYLF domain-containing protein [Steroidobacteraceae bacterium]HLS82620.1 lipid-binding SYLF domain-containing protein [Steroidobacter sp.]